jgi:nicotinate-nucleotide pyrophosphorylase (carboxylating)
LYDAFLIKENHVVACGGITAAIERARALAPEKKIIVEVETLAELEEAAAMRPDQIMLDNFTSRMLEEATSIATKSSLEVSGNLTVDNAGALPRGREWFLSSGALTKHVQATDLSLRLQ